MEAKRYDKEDLQEALRVLRNGGIIVYPTDTVWGIGCDATNETAVQRIYALKQREDSKSMLVLLDSPAKLAYYVGEVPEAASLLLEATDDVRRNDVRCTKDVRRNDVRRNDVRCTKDVRRDDGVMECSNDGMMKPLTIIYPHARNMAKNLIAEDGSIGIRITNEPFSKALCEQLRHPIVSTSANISGHPAAPFYAEIEEEILNGADYVCRFRREDDCPHEPSSIIKINDDGSFRIIRS